jgi:hypothetical protein
LGEAFGQTRLLLSQARPCDAPFGDYAAYGNYDYAAYGNECWRQEWTGYGWQWVNVCYGYGY